MLAQLKRSSIKKKDDVFEVHYELYLARKVVTVADYEAIIRNNDITCDLEDLLLQDRIFDRFKGVCSDEHGITYEGTIEVRCAKEFEAREKKIIETVDKFVEKVKKKIYSRDLDLEMYKEKEWIWKE